MVMQQPYHAGSFAQSRYAVWYVALLVPVVVLMGLQSGSMGKPKPLHQAGGHPLFASSMPADSGDSILPVVLTSHDIAQYQTIFIAQKAHDWASADQAIDRLHNKVLLGHVLAGRYLSGHYDNTPEQLADWLKQYSDQPQAASIYARALALMPSLKEDVPLVRKQAALPNYGDDHGMTSPKYGHPYALLWQSGLQAWKNGQKNQAAKLFAEMAQHRKELTPWTAAAANYWAYRSYHAIGNEAEALTYLRSAAAYSRSFYGILARKRLHLPLDLDIRPVELTDSDVLEMIGDQTIRRVVALCQAGQTELAERELRQRYPDADDDEKPRLLALAHELGLASLQISMAKDLSRDAGGDLDFARYPIPNWQPDGGFTIDPLLVFSLIRQESGFRVSAVSQSGALGLMQLMPKTASLMQRKMGAETIADNVAEPVVNITLGQNYVQHLLDNNLVDGNLIYLLAAYNAGPGRLQEWKKQAIGQDDPLLFIESIPITQTRHYVMQVMTNYWVYSELAGAPNPSVTALLRDQFPSYTTIQNTIRGPLAERTERTPAG